MSQTHKPSVASKRMFQSVVACIALVFCLFISGCASTGVVQKKPLSDEQAIYVTTGTYKSQPAQEAGKQSKKSSGAADKFFGDFLGNLVVEGLIRLLIP